MKTDLTKSTTVDISLLAKKNKTRKTKYDIYISFCIYEQGVRQFQPYTLSTGINVNVSDWEKDRVKGKNAIAQNINEKLFEYLSIAKGMINKLSAKDIINASDLLAEIKANAKILIIGKAPKGKQQEIISRLQQYTFENVMNRLLEDRKLSKGRIRGYKTGQKLLNKYFNSNMPTINLITDTNLIEFKKWFLKNHAKSQNGATDYLSKIASVFKYAQELKIITTSPLPPFFRGQWVDAKREVLSEKDVLTIIKIDDNILTKSEQVIKYCMLLEILTGVNYCDLKSMTYEHIKFDEEIQQEIIEKNRDKNIKNLNSIPFITILTSKCKAVFEKLKDLTGGGDDNKVFNLPSIDFINREYKKIAKRAEITKRVTTVLLRHTFAVHYMEKDGHIEDLAKRLGQSDLKTTQIYGKISIKRLAQKSMELESKSTIHQLHPILKAV